MKPSLQSYLQLHFVVLIFGFTAILGQLISIPPLALVFWRTGLATVGMWAFLKTQKSTDKASAGLIIRLLLTGGLVALHWILFFGSARVSNVSVCLAGLSTSSLWTALLEPLFTHRRLSLVEVFLGLLVMVGLYLIFLFEFNHALGLTMSVVAALLSALFSIFNSLFARTLEPRRITAYEMAGAWISTAIFLPIYYFLIAPKEKMNLIPQGWDWLWVLILAGVCTVYAYAAFVRLFQTFSAFVMNLTTNLEPIYGIILAFLIFGSAEKMTAGFYAGASLILGAVLLYPILNRWSNRRAKASVIS